MASSSSHQQFANLRIPLEEIVSGTTNFSDANLIRETAFGKAYKGHIFRSEQLIDIVAERLDRKHESYGDVEFWKEISMLSSLKHGNLASVFGFCEEKEEKIIIYKDKANGSLDKFITDPSLTWMRRLKICVGVAHALSYIHFDKRRDFSVIHRDIRSSKILVDDRWEAKLCGFEVSINQKASRRNRLCLINVRGMRGYCDPMYVKSGIVTHKSDMYYFGVVLFEVLFGNKAMMVNEANNNRLLAPLAISHYEGGRLDDMIDPGLWKQMDPQSFKIFSEIAYYCLKEQRSQRPNIHQIVMKLEKALESQQKHEDPAYSTVEGIASKSLKGKNLEHLRIPLSDIVSATRKFSKKYLIGSGTYGEVYKAELDHFDGKYLLPFEEKKESELPKKRSIVAIKRIRMREDKQGEKGFLAEIEMLSSCKHPNIVSLLGFCEEGRHMILVYEHASNGSLDDYLEGSSKLGNLSWMQRIKICIDIARGLNYLHTKIENERRIIHRDIKSDNILLGENWEAKIADFGLSKFHPDTQQVNKTLYTTTLAGTEMYWDPEYVKTGKLKNESDIYSFGVVLFEILSGKFANDPTYTKENSNGIAPVARRCFNEGTIKDMVDHRLMEETYENIFTLNRGPDQDSLDAFSKIAYQCVAETQAERPTAEVIIKKLEEALSFQENIKDNLKLSLEGLISITENFSSNNLIGKGGFGKVYKGEVAYADGHNTVAAKRLDKSLDQGEYEFLVELEILFEYKHENIIGLVGYCDEMDEKIIVYEYASRGSLDKHLSNYDLTWRKRLEICIDIATALDFLHGGGSPTQDVVIHRDIKSYNILLNDEWKAKIADFGLSLTSAINKDMDYVFTDLCGTIGYVDPLYLEFGFLTRGSDIYSLGVVLFEILCGRVVCEIINGQLQVLTPLFIRYYKEGKLDEIVFEGIKEQAVPKSLTTFKAIAYQCLHYETINRPTASEVLLQLRKALEFQDDCEIWEPKLPKDYEQILKMSNFPEIYSTEKKKDLYNMLSKGILLQESKVLFSLGDNGERNGMISARKFLYKRRSGSHKWRCVTESRFDKVAKMLDISNLKIQAKIKPQFVSPGVSYGVHLVFRFCGPRKSVAKRMYVNLKYKKGSETLHTYFATWREDGWMTIELCRFWNHKEDTDFELLLESFSRCYCETNDIYIEGIEFRAIDNVKHEIKYFKGVQQLLIKSDLSMEQVQQFSSDFGKEVERFENYDEGEKLFLLNEVNKKKHYMLSAKEVLYKSTDVKPFNVLPSTDSRFENVIELLRQQVFRIKHKIESQSLSPDTKYTCYLVFKLSEKCRGLHCPVIVRDLLKRKNKEKGILYFRSPSPCNINDTDQVPKEREDGWMEVNVWQFNSTNELRDDCVSINLKLISYEGTMSGLIINSLEFRPM